MPRTASLYDTVVSEAKAAKVPPELVFAVMKQENPDLDPRIRSPKGAIGLMQLMPDTAKELGVNPENPLQNLRGGIRYLRQQLEASGGNVETALARYNFGPGNVQAGRAYPTETRDYIQKVTKESDFRRWYGQHAQQLSLSPDPDSQPEYDYRAAFQAGATPDASGHWPSDFKKAGHPNAVVGGFDTRTGQRVPGTKRAYRQELIAKGWDPKTAARMNILPEVGQPPPLRPLQMVGGMQVGKPSIYQTARPEDFGGPTAGQYYAGMGADILESFDPRTRTGRRNWMGPLGAAAGIGVAATAGVPVGIGLGAAGVLGAATGGGLQEAWESLTSPPPPGGRDALTRINLAAIEQGAYEWGGQIFTWPFRALGRRAIAPRVQRLAAEHIKRQQKAVISQFDDQLSAAERQLRVAKASAGESLAGTRARVGERVAGAQAAAETGVSRVQEAARGEITGARRAGLAGIGRARTAAEQAPKAAEGRFAQIGGPPPSAAGREALGVLAHEGPAMSAKREAGELVERTAASGPDVSLADIKAEAQQMVRRATPSVAGGMPTEVTALLTGQGAAGDVGAQRLARLQAAGIGVEPTHPLPGVLAQLEALPDTIPFSEAHKLKRLLDEAVDWESPARKQVKQITKGVRTLLRDRMSQHAPYEQATAAYQAIVPLYTKGNVPRVIRTAIEDPGASVHLLSPRFPAKARLFRDVLVEQSAEVGEGARGQAAWDSVRAAWTHEKIVKKLKLGTIEDYFNKLDPDFDAIMFGDATGSSVKRNLIEIDQAFRNAVESGAAGIEEATAVGKAGMELARARGAEAVGAAKRAGAEGVRATRVAGARELQAGRQVKQAIQVGGAEELAELEQARQASLAPIRGQMEALKAARLTAAPPIGGIVPWKVSLVARALHGPKGAELIKWAAFSPRGTQLLVDALTSPTPGRAVSDLMRWALGSTTGEYVAPSTVGTPPPTKPTPSSRVLEAGTTP